MIKLVYVIRRRSDLSPEQFRKRWLVGHAPLVREVSSAIGARRYVQSHTFESPLNGQLAASRGMGEGFDGITEVWWEDLGALLAGMGSPEGIAAAQRLLDDEREFIDLPASFLFLTEEHPIFDFTAR